MSDTKLDDGMEERGEPRTLETLEIAAATIFREYRHALKEADHLAQWDSPGAVKGERYWRGIADAYEALLKRMDPKAYPVTFKIVRMFQNSHSFVVKRGLTLAEAKAHCQDPETHSKTATSEEARRRTNARGPWFDGFERDTA